MRVAIVSDVHGNLVALEAALAELARLGPFDAIVGGGDYAAAGAQPAECLARIQREDWPGVRGNTDEWIVEAATDGRVPARDYAPAQAHTGTLRDADRWTAARLTSNDVNWLASLPLAWRATGPSGQTLALVHATPWSAHDIVLRAAPDEPKLRMLDESGADALVYGHIHDAYIQQFGARTLACAGSVGMPADGDQRGAFLIATDEGDGWRLELHRVAYDLPAYLAALSDSDLPGAERQTRVLQAASLRV